VPDEIRVRWRSEAGRIGAGELHSVLAARDPAMAARLRPTDPQRIVRALEVFEATGRSLAEWQETPGEPAVRPEEALSFVVTIDREELHRRCDLRFDNMMDAGAVEEAAHLASMGLDPELPAMRALGVRPLLDHLAGKSARDEAAALAKAETRQYAKRQETWIKSNMSAWKRIYAQQIESNMQEILSFIDS
jgi:tRNA dimethylallyltransferase